MEVELEPRVKLLQFEVKAMSRESPSQKALNVLDSDLRSHWSTAINTKEWILLELNPKTFQKVRPRCEAPRRDMTYPTNYTPCQYVRISCLRGNPVPISFVQCSKCCHLSFLRLLTVDYFKASRTTSKHPGNISDSEVYKSSQLSRALTVSSNFEASRIIQKVIDPEQNVPSPQNVLTDPLEEKSKLELTSPCTLVDYSNLFGEEFRMTDEHWDCSYLNVLDIGAVEKGILHVLYFCAAQVRTKLNAI
ncbi:uncharacterized protein LOC131616188 [Vicia villosa]|uniref:uncharacterized protein LOC131616188 n=1 Tax=Vicia villosa TaxID=3911 RepID=UPI00273C4386|nr:uncharacterized protein LOC131616188 [Vicia villosa]